MRRNAILIITGIIILILAAAIYFFIDFNKSGRNFMMYGPPGREKIIRKLNKELNLTNEQIKQINKISDRHDKELQVYKNRISQILDAVKKNIVIEKINRKEVQRVFEQMNPVMREMRKIQINRVLECYMLLDTEQKKKARDMLIDTLDHIQDRLGNAE